MKTVVVLVALLLTACSGTGEQSTAPADESALPASTGGAESSGSDPTAPSPSEESRPSTSAEVGDGTLCAVGHEPCSLEAGTYSAAPFEPEFEFTVDEGWQNDRAYADGGGISREQGGIYWASGVSSTRVGDEEVEIEPGPDALVAFLQSLAAAGLTVSEPTLASVGGVEGQQIDVETGEAPAPGLLLIEEDAFNLAPNEKARFIVLEVEGETVVLIVDAFATEDFDEWVETAQPVVDSIEWQ